MHRFRPRTQSATREFPWCVLAKTGNGIGRAPDSLRSMSTLDDDAFDELLGGELFDAFCYQVTIDATTPFQSPEASACSAVPGPRAKSRGDDHSCRNAR